MSTLCPPLKKRGAIPEIQPKTSPDFYDRISPKGNQVFLEEFRASLCSDKRWLVTKSPWEYNGKETNETSFKCLKKKKKKRFAPDSSQGRCTMVLSYFLGGNKQEEEKPETSLSKSTFPLSVFNLWTSEGILMASYFLPHPQQAIFRFSYIIRCLWKWKDDSHLRGFWQKEHQNASPHFQPTNK